MLILQTLARGKPLHGFEIAESIQQTSDDVLQVEEGSLYPALQRMLVKGWIAGDWGKTAGNRRARYYSITPVGRAELRTETARWNRYAETVTGILNSPQSA